MRLGVDRALDPELPPGPVLEGARNPSDDAGLCGVRKPPLSADGRGSRLEDPECMCTGLVNRRETLAVAVDVPSVGAGKGVRGRKVGRRVACPSDCARDMGDAFGWSSKILRRAWRLRTGFIWGSDEGLEEEEERDEREGFSVGGVNGRVVSTSDGGMSGGVIGRLLARDRAGLEYGERVSDGAVLGACEELVVVSVDALGRCPKRKLVGGREIELVDGRRFRKDESRVYTVLDGSGGVGQDRGEEGPGEGGGGGEGDRGGR